MIRIGAAALLMALAGAGLAAAPSHAQGAPSGTRLAQALPPDQVSPRRGRPPTRLRVHPTYTNVPEVYPRYYPGPNSVRQCEATYVQEYRPSGTVIVPRMSCRWVNP